MNIIQNYYHIVVALILMIRVQFSLTIENVAIFLTWITFCGFKEYMSSRGKILDKDAIALKYEEINTKLSSEIEALKVQIEETKKESSEVKSKLSLVTAKNTQLPTGVKW